VEFEGQREKNVLRGSAPSGKGKEMHVWFLWQLKTRSKATGVGKRGAENQGRPVGWGRRVILKQIGQRKPKSRDAADGQNETGQKGDD